MSFRAFARVDAGCAGVAPRCRRTMTPVGVWLGIGFVVAIVAWLSWREGRRSRKPALASPASGRQAGHVRLSRHVRPAAEAPPDHAPVPARPVPLALPNLAEDDDDVEVTLVTASPASLSPPRLGAAFLRQARRPTARLASR